VQALDHAAGYVMAAAALVGLTQRLACGRAFEAMTSLARMADLLTSQAADDPDASLRPAGASDFAKDREETAWGRVLRLLPPLEVEGDADGLDAACFAPRLRPRRMGAIGGLTAR
jgi:hypothetical protein